MSKQLTTMEKKNKKHAYNLLQVISHKLRVAKRGFTLIEILAVFAIIGVISSVSVASINSYNQTQIFSTAVSDVKSLLATSRSKAISQVKPSSCGLNRLDGYRVSVTITGQSYQQQVVCAGTAYLVAQKQLPGQLTFASGSSSQIDFNVSTGVLNSSGVFVISGFGKTNWVNVDKVGTVTVTNSAIVPTPTPTSPPPTPTPTTAAPTPTNPPPPTPIPTTPPPTPTPTTGVLPITGNTYYSDWSTIKSGFNLTTITVQAVSFTPNALFDLVTGIDGGNGPCSQNVVKLAAGPYSSDASGSIANTSASINRPSGTWQVCFKEFHPGQSVTYPVTFTVW